MANDKNFKVKNGLTAKRYLQSGSALAASDVDVSSGSYFTKTLTANTTLTFSNPPPSGSASSFALEITGADVAVGYDLANATYDNVTFSFSAQDNGGRGLFFKPDGTKFYIAGDGGNDINEYSMSTAWDLSTASYTTVFSTASQDNSPFEVFFKSDGTKMYVLGDSSNAIFQYSLSTAWDVSTASYDSVNFSYAGEEGLAYGLTFKPDGTKFYISGVNSSDVFQYSLSTAWDLSTASYDNVNFNASTQETAVTAVEFSSDGTKMFVIGYQGDDVNEYSLSTAWDVSSASYVQNFSVSAQATFPASIRFKPDGTKMYILKDPSNFYQYSTASSTPATVTYPSSVKWSGATTPDAPADGEKDLYVFVTTDGGTTYYGKQAGDALA